MKIKLLHPPAAGHGNRDKNTKTGRREATYVDVLPVRANV